MMTESSSPLISNCPRSRCVKYVDALKRKGIRYCNYENQYLEVTTRFEVRAPGAHQLTFLLVELCPAVRAGTFDLFGLRCITCGGRRGVCHLVVLCRSTRPDGRG